MLALVAVLALTLAPQEPAADAGATLLKLCQEPVATEVPDEMGKIRAAFGDGFCSGYLSASWDALHRLGLSQHAAGLCIPEDATWVRAANAVMKFLRDNPQRLDEHRFDLVLAALRQAWPCPEGK